MTIAIRQLAIDQMENVVEQTKSLICGEVGKGHATPKVKEATSEWQPPGWFRCK